MLTSGEGLGDVFDVVVVGSGFGGSVAAYRLAAGGQKVCVLERGKAYPPGSFPRTPAELSRAMWDPSEGLHGMFDIWSFRGIDAVTASGLGGGSLIYANVLLRKDPAWFRQPHPYRPGEWESWPIGYDDLAPSYQRVEGFLEAQTLPDGPGAPPVPKYDAMAAAAARADRDWCPAPLAVRFRDSEGVAVPPGTPLPENPEYPNIHGPAGRTRRTCRLCGECDIGCNDGAKNTLDHTYLSAASNCGAVVSVRTEVVALRTVAEGFEVDVAVHRAEHEGRKVPTRTLPRQTLRARRVIMAAGSVGSTYLLLSNRRELGITSPALGTRYCGNGDLLGVVLNARDPVGGSRVLDGSRGPVISSYVRWPDEADDPDDPSLEGKRGFYVEDAGYPAFLQWMLESAQLPAAVRRAARFSARQLFDSWRGRRSSALSAELSKLLGPGELTATSVPLLGMGRDVPDGRFHLRDENGGPPMLDNTWSIATSEAYFNAVYDGMAALAEAMGASFLRNPHYLLRRVITVHSSGGCPMGVDTDQSVVDADCRVHGVPGLYVADGSVFPGPVGPNPALTIAAVADRMCDRMLEGVG